MRPARKTMTFRRERAQDIRKKLDHYRRSLDDRDPRLITLGEVTTMLSQLVMQESDHALSQQAQMLYSIGQQIQEAGREVHLAAHR